MTAPVAVKAPTNGQRRPVRLVFERHQLVGTVMDGQVLAVEAMEANGAVLTILNGFDRDAAVYEAIRASHDVHARLMQLLIELRALAGKLDGRPE